MSVAGILHDLVVYQGAYDFSTRVRIASLMKNGPPLTVPEKCLGSALEQLQYYWWRPTHNSIEQWSFLMLVQSIYESPLV